MRGELCWPSSLQKAGRERSRLNYTLKRLGASIAMPDFFEREINSNFGGGRKEPS